MGRKRSNKKPKNHLASALDRLATTVKADDKTILMGNAGRTVKASSEPKLGNRFATGVSRMARRMIPGRPIRGHGEAIGQIDAKANKRMQKIARKLARGQNIAPKQRRSRLPYLVALLLGLIAGGAYYSYQTVQLPDLKIMQTVETKYKSWFSNVATTTPKVKTQKWKKPTKKVKRTIVRSGVKKSNAKMSYKKKATARRITKKTPKSVKKKIWASKLAKLKKTSKSKYRKASYKYRKKKK